MSVAVVMGSKSDLEIVRGAFDVLKEFGVPFTGRVLSAHRTPEEAAEFAANAEKNGVKLGQPMWAVRISLSGLPATPGGPAEIMEVLGKEESMRRLNAGLAMLS